MTTSTITPEIASFAAAVRAALHDLPADERDELTDGLEADLAEAYAEDLARELPDPSEYATELRDAAGLPKVDDQRSGLISTLGVSVRRTKADLAGVVRRNPALAPVADFLVSIRPLWWVVRAWIAYWLIAAFIGFDAGFLPGDTVMWVVLLAFTVISVQWGRGRWVFRGVRPLIVVGNVIAAVLLVPVVAMADDWTTQISYPYYSDDGPVTGDSTGVYLDGSQVTNIFPYDSAGRLIKDVQLFDQDGRPLSTSVPDAIVCADEQCDVEGLWAPRTLESGASVLNVFPLSMIAGIYGDEGLVADPNARPQERPAPLLKVPALEAAPTPQQPEKVAPSNE